MSERPDDVHAIPGAAAFLPPIELDAIVPCTPRTAFLYFTRDIARWWPLSHHSCSGARAAGVAFEEGVGGRLIETDVDGRQYVWGTVQVWEPGRALAFSWHPGKPVAAALTVSLTFQEAGATTRVRLVHSGWERLGESAAKGAGGVCRRMADGVRAPVQEPLRAGRDERRSDDHRSDAMRLRRPASSMRVGVARGQGPSGFIPQAPAGPRPRATPDILPIQTACVRARHKRRIAGPRAAQAGGRLSHEARRLVPPAALRR